MKLQPEQVCRKSCLKGICLRETGNMCKYKMIICIGSSCFVRGNARNVEIAEKFLADNGLTDEVDIDLAGGLCTGNCSDGPIVAVNGKIYRHVDPGVMLDLLYELFPEKRSGK